MDCEVVTDRSLEATGAIADAGGHLKSMNRRAFLRVIGSAALLPILPHRLWASTNFRRRRPSDAAWPSPSAWKQLNDSVGGNLIPVNFPLSVAKSDLTGTASKSLWESIRNPYYIGEQGGVGQLVEKR